MRPRLVRAAACAALALGAACASSGGSASPSAGPRYERNRISSDEIAQGLSRNINNAYDLIQSMRPQWIRTGSTGFGGAASTLAVFEDNNRLGGVEALRSYPLGNVSAIRFLQPSEAGALFGLDVNYGAIQIQTRTGR